jgi:hypothetical protein
MSRPPLPKVTLDAMTDQALAAAAKAAGAGDPLTEHTLTASREVAAVLAEQFRGDEVLAGRAVMCASQMLAGLVVRFQGAQVDDASIGPLVANIFAFAAEQVVREAGAT